MATPIDTRHLGIDRVICAWEVAPGVIVDPGPASAVETLLEGVEAEPRALLLTHIHLDHAGAAGVLARRFPKLRVYVHEIGAPHVIDPSRLIASASRLYGDEMDRLWGEIAPVPAERVTALRGAEEVEGCRVEYAPGHASHHVVYFHADSRDAFVGDVAGIRIPPGELALAPTPPPDIDIEAWFESLRRVAALEPRRLCLTHFGAVDEPTEQLAAVERWLEEAGRRSENGDREAFDVWVSAQLEAVDDDIAARLRQAMPPDHLWLGLERYWRKRREREG